MGAHLGLPRVFCSLQLLQRLVITPKGDLSELFLSLFETCWGEMKLTFQRHRGFETVMRVNGEDLMKCLEILRGYEVLSRGSGKKVKHQQPFQYLPMR